MKILMLTPYLPYPPASGGQIRTLYLLKYLRANHDVTLVSLYKNEDEKKYAENLREYCNEIYLCKRAEKPWQIKNILRAVLTALPFLIVRNFSKEASVIIKDLLATNDYDVIHAETFYIMPHIPPTKVPVLLVEQTIEYKVYQHYISPLPAFLRWPLWLDIFKLKFWEKYYWSKANLVATVSESDQEQIKQLLPKLKTVIIPNGAGDEMFVTKFPKLDKEKPKLLFIGNFFWLQNVEAAEYLLKKVFPKLKEKLPNAELIIAGQNGSAKLSKQTDPQIKIVDLKPDDEQQVKNLYHSATLFIAPIYGPGGTRLKILASMASGLPVVSTKTGVQGLAVKNNEHVLIAQNPEEFVTSIIHILNDSKKYELIQKNAFKLAKENYSWNAIAEKLEKVYKGIMH
jgi:glycosyltransferase involved in cell wall biosynthesis